MTDNEDWKTEALRGLGVTMEELEAVAVARKVSHRNGGVCVCGHAAKSHTEFADEGAAQGKHDAWRAAGQSRCIPSLAPCECRGYNQVLTAQDLRKFRHTTKGAANAHALMQGVFASVQAGKELYWDPAVACAFCKADRDSASLVPVAYAGFTEAHESTQNNVMVCETCRDSMRHGVVPGRA